MKLQIIKQVAASLLEDVGGGDITAELIPASEQAKARIISREQAVICGRSWVDEVWRQVDPLIKVTWLVEEGDAVEPGQAILELQGRARSLVMGERTALNWLQTLSATATEVAKYAAELKGTQAKLLDTRKTIPGFREAQKYAVKIGGGMNHRMGLFDAFLIKENHIAACGSIKAAVGQARENYPNKTVEVEVESLDELQQALDVGADIIMLDNFDLDKMREAVSLNARRAKLEVSGNVERQNLAAIAKTGVDYISVGAITKHVRAVDLSMRFVD